MRKKKKIEDYEIELIEGKNAYNIFFQLKKIPSFIKQN